MAPDLIHANSSRAALYAGLAGKILRIPVLFHCRVSVPDPGLDALLVHLVTAVIANSQATANRFAAWPKLSVHVVHNGVDLPQDSGANPRPAGAGRVLLSVSRLSRWKRHDLLLDLFARLADRDPSLHLVCVGGNDPDDAAWGEALRQRTAAAPWGDRVHWPGHADDLGSWYAAADLFVHAAKDEPFGRVFVEAMGSGLPVVAFAGGGAPEVVKSGGEGVLVKEGDLSAMAAAIEELLSDDELRKRMGEAGRARAAVFSVSAHVAAVERVYAEVLGDD